MGKISKVNIAAARAQRDILVRRGKSVPENIRIIAELDPDRLPNAEAAPAPGPMAGAAPKQESAPHAPEQNFHDTVNSWMVAVLRRDFAAREKSSGVVEVPKNSCTSLVPFPASMQTFSRASLLENTVFISESQSEGVIYLVNEDNVGRAEQFIHGSGESGKHLPPRPPVG